MAVALHHLGVEMGDVPRHKAIDCRPYWQCECESARREFGALPLLAGEDVMFWTAKRYIDRRLREASGPCGVKFIPLVLLGLCGDVETLPITVVYAKRNLDDTFASDIKYRGVDVTRAMLRGACHLALRELVRRVPPACVIEYQAACGDPENTVLTLVESLGLTPTVEQWRGAVASIDPINCKREINETTVYQRPSIFKGES